MIRYDIYLLQLGFRTVALVGKLVQNCTIGETIRKTLQEHRKHKIDNKHTESENEHKKNI